MALTVESKAFDDGDEIPERFTCDGGDLSPPLSIQGVPEEAETLALLVDDPDAPGDGAFVHWVLWNLPTDITDLPEEVPKRGRAPPIDDAPQGSNDFGRAGYGGPCPPKGDGPHTYRFRAFAVDGELDLGPGSNGRQLEEALEGRVLAEGQLTGTFER